MWLITEQGFASVVAHREKEDVLLVRSRAEGDLLAFCRLAGEEGIEGFDASGIWEDPSADYRWRMEVDRKAVAELARAMVDRVDYDNFKSRVGAGDPERASIYARVWEALYEIQRTR
jgi:hypothetical protein